MNPPDIVMTVRLDPCICLQPRHKQYPCHISKTPRSAECSLRPTKTSGNALELFPYRALIVIVTDAFEFHSKNVLRRPDQKTGMQWLANFEPM